MALAHQRRGVGGALYEHVMATLAPFDPSVLRANAYADQPQGLEFMLRRGFFEAWRETPVRLDLAAVDLAPYSTWKGSCARKASASSPWRSWQVTPGWSTSSTTCS